MTAPPVLLVTGGAGYVARHVIRRAGGWQVYATFHHAPPNSDNAVWRALDVRDGAAVAALVQELRPTAIIHTAYQMNTPDMDTVVIDGTRHVAQAAVRVGARLVHLSTDVVFDGRRGHYRESDSPSPIHAYGMAKAQAEAEIKRNAPNAAIVRTSLVYGFDPLDRITAWVLDSVRQGSPITLFTDEFRCPIFATDLADALLELARNDISGPIHVAGPQVLSRYDMGIRLCRAFGLDETAITPAPAASSGLTRPLNCTLDTNLAQQRLRALLRGVDDVLASVFPAYAPPTHG
ncbi:MAG: SDR family oxidoreductase [Anaerolineae bacterium]